MSTATLEPREATLEIDDAMLDFEDEDSAPVTPQACYGVPSTDPCICTTMP